MKLVSFILKYRTSYRKRLYQKWIIIILDVSCGLLNEGNYCKFPNCKMFASWNRFDISRSIIIEKNKFEFMNLKNSFPEGKKVLGVLYEYNFRPIPVKWVKLGVLGSKWDSIVPVFRLEPSFFEIFLGRKWEFFPFLRFDWIESKQV